MKLTDATILNALRAAFAHADENNADRAQLMPLFPNGSAARPVGPPSGVTPRQGAVLAVLYPCADELMVLLTVRSTALRNHRGEISLPGGSVDESDRSLVHAALRECHEELGIEPTTLTVLGHLTPVYIAPSNFQITPFVAWSPVPPNVIADQREVAAVLHLPLRHLLRPDAVVVEDWVIRGRPLRVPFYPFGEHKIWGATAIVLSQLAARVRDVIGTRG